MVTIIESSNGRFRVGPLKPGLVPAVADDRGKMKGWRQDYAEFRPSDAIGSDISRGQGRESSPPF